MGYRPDEQSLETPILKILDGFSTFDSAVNERINSQEWDNSHISELNELRKDMLNLQIKLEKVKLETW